MKKIREFKSLIVIMILFLFVSNGVYSEDQMQPKPYAYRVGTSDEIEKRYEKVKEEQSASKAPVRKKLTEKEAMSYGDLTLKSLSSEIYADLEYDQEFIVSDLQILWLGAASKSESVKFAIYKLSNPEEDKSSTSIVKRRIRPIASASTLAGISMGDPIIGSAALAAGNLLSSLSVSDKELNYKFSKVTDADMIVLMRKIDDLQKKLASQYFDYIRAYELLKMMDKNLANRSKRCEVAQTSDNKAHILITDAYYKSAIDKLEHAKSDFLFKRSALEQLVGEKTLQEFEQSVFEREKSK